MQTFHKQKKKSFQGFIKKNEAGSPSALAALKIVGESLKKPKNRRSIMLTKKTPELKKEANTRSSSLGGYTESKEFSSLSQVHKKNHSQSRIVVKSDVGFGNQLYIRGKGAKLSWDKGLPLKNIKNDEWVWETEEPFTICEFKILINDSYFEAGDNHLLDCGATLQYAPTFS